MDGIVRFRYKTGALCLELVGFLLRYHCGIDLGVLELMQCNAM